jgi:hypothetical protein
MSAFYDQPQPLQSPVDPTTVIAFSLQLLASNSLSALFCKVFNHSNNFYDYYYSSGD